jgi:uncharacterized protein
MSTYEASIEQMSKMLGNLDRWLERASEHAREKDFSPDVFLASRLAPDQYALVRQVQNACDSAKFAAARLSGKEAPKHPDTEETMDALRARIRTVTEYLDAFTAADFAGADERQIELPVLQGNVLDARDYLFEMALPNFYFHLTHAYAVLRHDGVALGKRDYIGRLDVKPRR